MTEKSYLETHPHIRAALASRQARILIYGAAILVAAGILGWMFGWDRIFELGERLLVATGLIQPEGVTP